MRKSGRSATKRFRAYIAGVLTGAAASALTLLLLSFAVYLLKLPASYGAFLSLVAFGAGCLTSGAVTGLIRRRSGLFSGVIAALAFMFPVAVATFAAGGFTGDDIARKLIVAVICGAAGGVIGVNKSNGF